MFITALFIIAKLWNQRRCPSTNEYIKNKQTNKPQEYYSAIKKNKIHSGNEWN
jgi:hypothetical protein